MVALAGSNANVVENTIVYVINDLAAGHTIPSMPMGETAEGTTLVAKAVFANEESANLMAAFMDQQANQAGRFEVTAVEIWRPTDIEKYVRERIRQHDKEKNAPKLIIPGG